MTHLRTNRSLEDMDRASHLHPFTNFRDFQRNGPLIVKKARGSRVWDAQGREYLDGAAGLWCVNVGHGRPEILEAMDRQARELTYFHTFNGTANEPSTRLAEKILERAPAGGQRVFFGHSGSDANDTNIKLAWYYNALRGLPDKKKIIARHRGYHGVTVAAGSCSGFPGVHDFFGLPLPTLFRHVAEPDMYRHCGDGSHHQAEYARQLAQELDSVIRAEGPHTVAAFIAEPVMGTGGVLVPPTGYFSEIKRVLDTHDVLFIADEVITGFGRLGAWFGTDLYEVEPDLVTIAKGLTSSYLPMSGSIVGRRVWSVIEDNIDRIGAFGHGFTCSGHPVAAAAALANLMILESEDLPTRAGRAGDRLLRALRDECSDHSLVGDIRGAGLMVGVELVSDKARKTSFAPKLRVGARVARAAVARGVLVRALPLNDVMAFSPPFIIEDSEIEMLVARFRAALDDVSEVLVRGEVLS